MRKCSGRWAKATQTEQRNGDRRGASAVAACSVWTERASGALRVLLAGACVALTVAPPVSAAEPRFGPVDFEVGVLNLAFSGAADGAGVSFLERVGARLEPLGTVKAGAGGVAILRDAATWSCGRLVRRFVATTTAPGGTPLSREYTVRTMSCAKRFALEAPRRVAPGAKTRIRVVDRWKIGGIRTRLCITQPNAEPACRTLAFRPAVTIANRRFRATTRGRWRVELRVRRHRIRTSIAVGGGASVRDVAPPAVLATGDSTMVGIDNFLADELGNAATLHSDVRVGTGISRGNFWTRHAASQTKRLRQRVTVISIGAGYDSFPLTTPAGVTVDCCDGPWALAYSRRARSIMRTYLRGGRGRVFWLTPPLQRDPARAKIATAITSAVVFAAQGLAGVSVWRVDRFFHSDVIRYRGRDVRVRDPQDEVHLNITGTAIAAQLLAPAIREALARRSTST